MVGKVYKIIFIFLTLLLINSCVTYKPPVLKSPCAAIESENGQPSPCIKRPANASWLL